MSCSKVVEKWESSIAAKFPNQVRIECLTSEVPQILVRGPYPLSTSQSKSAVRERTILKKMNRLSDAHAVLVGEPAWHENPALFEVLTLDFAALCALRKDGLKPRIVSACAVIVCPKLRMVLLHTRGETVATYPKHLHTLGGPWIPPNSAGGNTDGEGLEGTIVREIREETQLHLAQETLPPMMLCQELETGFVQLVLLGIATDSIDNLEGNWEGDPTLISYDEIPTILFRELNWVPSGKAHLLAWLALGAPNAGTRARFGGSTAHQLFRSYVGT
jgi:ADP-ribose pyrophosphatase YjhB (NUDIX family)